MTLSTNRVTSTRMRTEALVWSMLAFSFSTLSFLKAISSAASLTKALMTEMPEKLSWAKSLSLEKASWRMSHFLVMYRPTTVAEHSSSAMGIRDSTVISGSSRSILRTASAPMKMASQNIMTPQPKHSWTVSRSLVNRLMRLPTLLTW